MKTTTPASLIQTITMLLKAHNLSESHQARVIEALKCGSRITPSQLAKHHGVHRVTIWKWVKAGIIPTPQGRGAKARWWDFADVKEIKT